MSATKKFDGNLYNSSSGEFVPVACHYDENTLLTKNGELLQTIQIRGINSENISKNLFNLREVVRASIRDNIECNKFAFWIHTVRRKADLDDDTEYHGFLAANVHDIWRRKNYWHDKFVNRLYITIVHDSPALKLTNFNSWVNSLSNKAVASFEEKFFKKASVELCKTVDSILDSLSAYGAKKLGIRMEGEECYSDPMFLYRRIMQLSEEDCPVPVADISAALASHNYAVGSDKIEVIGEDGKKFAAMMSIKEYQEISSEALDKFLQIPVEMIATEVFYFVDRHEVASAFEKQDYILGISGASDLRKLKGLDKILDAGDDGVKFCRQKISFMVMGEDLSALDRQVSQASEALSKIGIVHVREDINLEKTFWAQLPGNFSFLSRMKPTIFNNVAALASLHNFPTGNQYNPWGRAITLLRTEKGTPYFMNFHDQANVGTTCIFGERKAGKTTLLNFLISEADKYRPTLLYITDNMDSGIYIKAKAGRWFQRSKNVINPLFCEDNLENRAFVFEFFKVIAKHHFDPLKKSELDLLKTLSKRVFSIDIAERKLSNIISTIMDSDKGAKELKLRLEAYLPGGAYHEVFEQDEPIKFDAGDIVAFNLQDFDDAAYTKKYYPKEKKLIEQFEYDLNAMRAVKAGIAFALQNLMKQAGDGPKILAIDNLQEILNLEYYSEFFNVCADRMTSMNGVFVSTVDTGKLQKIHKNNKTQEWIANVNTKFILPSDLSVSGWDELFGLDLEELKKLSKLDVSSRMFLIKQDGKTIASELSIGGLPALTRILSSGKMEREIYKEIIQKVGRAPEDWVPIIYDEFENIV